jgi:aldose 1-epimerase
MTDILRLTAGALALEICPALGGSITRFDQRHEGRTLHWMRPTPEEAIARLDPIGVACFPLVPFSNRLRHGRFAVDDRIIELPLNFPPERHALHGDGWQHRWAVLSATQDSAALGFVWQGALRYEARQDFRLAPDALEIRIAVTNRGEGRMPAGIGLHPWFPLTPEARMTAAVDSVFLVDAEYMPLAHRAPPERWDFRRGVRFRGSGLANNFTGWDGSAAIAWPEHGMRLTMTSDGVMDQLVCYCPDGADFFCVEPVSNSVDGFNLGALGSPHAGYRLLAPGATLAGTTRFAVAVD